MRATLVLVVLFLLAAVSSSVGGPITGVWFDGEKIAADPWTRIKRFKGGERAAVLVRGGNPRGAGLHLVVHDGAGKIVAETTGKDPPASDMVAVFWYPPRDADYRIEIRNLDAGPNECNITIK